MHSFPVFAVPRPDAALRPVLQEKIDQKTKPFGALGQLEAIALQLGLVQGSLSPRLKNPHLLVFAGDHGAANAGVSAFPQEVTWQMVENFLAGGAAINVFARQNGLALKIIDAGVNHDFALGGSGRAGLVDAKVALGTQNYLESAAMSRAQCCAAVTRGATLVRSVAETGCTVMGFGEMGIGNTASASLITHCLTRQSLAACIGRGTGLDDAGLARKQALLGRAMARCPGLTDPVEVLCEFGGFEIAMLTGALLAAAECGLILLIDGFIVTAALLIAARLHPAILDYCVFSHCSGEPGHRLQLEDLGGTPVLNLGLRLGEGTGAALVYPIVQAAANFLNDMASFAAAGVAEAL